MASVKTVEQDPVTMLHWFTGKVLRLRTGQGDYFVHENLVNAKCATTGVNFVNTIRREQASENIHGNEMTGFSHFLLWLNCDSMGPLGNDPEKSYLDAFCMAHRYGLTEFEEFVSKKFSEFAPVYYGGGRDGDIHNPTLNNLVFAHEQLKNKPAWWFIIEQFARSWTYRRAYNKMELTWLVDKHPELVKALFQTVQDVVRPSQKKSLATFEWCTLETNVDAVDAYELTDVNEDRGERITVEDDHDDCSCQQSSNGQHMSSTEDFEVVGEERPYETSSSEPVYPEESVDHEPHVPYESEPLLEESFPVPEDDPEEKTPIVDEEIWGSVLRPQEKKKKKKTSPAWGWGVPEPIAEECKEEVAAYTVEDSKPPTIKDSSEPRSVLAGETIQKPGAFGFGTKKKKAKGGKKGKKVAEPVKVEV